jgi:hypothetical protein
MALGQVELALRVAAGLFVIVTPTLLFLGLWNWLESMRDDELIQRAHRRAKHMEQTESGSWRLDAAAMTAAATGNRIPDGMTSCASCGAHNRTDMTYCQECLGKLSK